MIVVSSIIPVLLSTGGILVFCNLCLFFFLSIWIWRKWFTLTLLMASRVNVLCECAVSCWPEFRIITLGFEILSDKKKYTNYNLWFWDKKNLVLFKLILEKKTLNQETIAEHFKAPYSILSLKIFHLRLALSSLATIIKIKNNQDNSYQKSFSAVSC